MIVSEKVRASNDQEDRRTHARFSGVTDAEIALPGASVMIGARIVDMSPTGARIELRTATDETGTSVAPDLPAHFVMVLQPDGGEIECQLVWQSDDCVGVRFLEALSEVG